MATHVNFKVNFKSNIIEFEQYPLDSTVAHIKQRLEEETTIPVESQKLMHKGRILKDDQVQLSQLNIQEGSKLILMGSLPAQIQQVNQLDKRIEEQKRIAPTIRLRKQQTQKRGPDPNAKYTFHKILK